MQLPLFLHSRAAHGDFVGCLKGVLGEDLEGIGKGGLVHSFTGTVEEMMELVALGLHVGVNGCSMKTEENLGVVKVIPLDRLQIETDGPWVSLVPSPYFHLRRFSVLLSQTRFASSNDSGLSLGSGWLIFTFHSARCVHHMPRRSIRPTPQHCPEPSKRRNGKAGSWSRAGTSRFRSAMLP